MTGRKNGGGEKVRGCDSSTEEGEGKKELKKPHHRRRRVGRRQEG